MADHLYGLGRGDDRHPFLGGMLLVSRDVTYTLQILQVPVVVVFEVYDMNRLDWKNEK